MIVRAFNSFLDTSTSILEDLIQRRCHKLNAKYLITILIVIFIRLAAYVLIKRDIAAMRMTYSQCVSELPKSVDHKFTTISSLVSSREHDSKNSRNDKKYHIAHDRANKAPCVLWCVLYSEDQASCDTADTSKTCSELAVASLDRYTVQAYLSKSPNRMLFSIVHEYY